jgi:type I restriction enzyme S subunit
MPQNWKTYKLSELTTKIGSGATPRGGKEAYQESGVSLIRSQNVLDFIFSENGLAFINDAQARALKNVVIETRDVLLNITGDSVARVCQVPDSWLPARVNQHVAIIRANQKQLSPEFLKYSLLSKTNKDRLLTIASAGATRNAITKSMIEDFEISIPNLQEQRSIASILSALDDKIEHNLAMNRTLEDMAMALYKHWFVDFGPFQNGEFIDSELGMIPKGWEVKSVYSIAEFINGAAFKSKDFVEDKADGLPVIKIAEIKQGITSQTNYSNKKLDKKYTIDNRDVLFPWSGNPHTSLGIHLWDKGKALLNQHVFVVRTQNEVAECYVFNTLKNLLPVFINLATHKQTTGLGHVTVANLKELLISFPSDVVLSDYNQKAKPIMDLIYSNQIENQTLTALRDTLLPKLISGEVRVKDAEQMLNEVL